MYPLVIKHGNGKSIANGGFNKKITDKQSIFQPAMFGCRRIFSALLLIYSSEKARGCYKSTWDVRTAHTRTFGKTMRGFGRVWSHAHHRRRTGTFTCVLPNPWFVSDIVRMKYAQTYWSYIHICIHVHTHTTLW